jgi:hypothetical protein
MHNPHTIKSKLKAKIARLMIASFINLIVTRSFFEASPDAFSLSDRNSPLRDSAETLCITFPSSSLSPFINDSV